MAKRFEKGDIAYLRVEISDFCKTGDRFDYLARIPHECERSEFPFCVKDEEVKTAEEVVKENYPLWDGVTQMDRITALEAENASLKESLHEASEENSANDEALAQMNIKKAELEAENEKLKRQLDGANELLTDAEAQVKKLTEADCMRLQEFKPIIEERDRLKGELEQERKRTRVWKDSAEEHRQRAEELEQDVNRYGMDIADNEVKIKRLGQENDSLKADILELKAQLNVFGARPSEIEELKAERDSARGQADLFQTEISELKERIKILEAVEQSSIRTKLAFSRMIKEKDFIISALVKNGVELQKGGESNG